MKNTPPSNEVLTYRRIRKAIGWLGISLPFVLLILSMIPFYINRKQTYTISNYYYTNGRDIFVGILCAIGLFLFTYKGHKNSNIFKNDSLLTNLAGGLAFGIALLPTNADCKLKIYTLIPVCSDYIGYAHIIFAGLFFIILAIICIKVFTIGDKGGFENPVYKIFGWTIIVSIILFVIFGYVLDAPDILKFVFEAIALIAFGISWLIKGRVIDKGRIGKMLYGET